MSPEHAPMTNGAFGGEVAAIVKFTVYPTGVVSGSPTTVPTGEYAGTEYAPLVETVGMHVSAGALHVPLIPQVSRRLPVLAGALTPFTQPIPHVSPGRAWEQPPPGPSHPRVITTFRKRACAVGGTAVADMLGFVTMVGFGWWKRPAVPV